MDEGNFCPLRYFELESKAKSTKIEAQQNKLLRGWKANLSKHFTSYKYVDIVTFVKPFVFFSISIYMQLEITTSQTFYIKALSDHLQIII